MGMPRPGNAGRGGDAVRPGGSQTVGEGMLVVFLTIDELRRFGPLGLRMWLEKNRPPRPLRLRPAEVIEFAGGTARPQEAEG